MADVKKVIEIDVETLRAQGGLDTFIGSLKETETQSISLKAQLRQLKEQLASLPEGTAEYKRVAQEAGNVSDKIGDINNEIKGLGSDTKGIDTVVQGAQLMSGAFSVATSAGALLGVENEDLQASMAKVESAIGLTVGVQSIANALQKETLLYKKLDATATKVQTGLQLAYNTVVGASTGVMKAFKIALASTGIGAIVVGLGLLIANFDSVKKVVTNLIPGLSAIGDGIMSIVNAVTDFVGATSEADRQAEAMINKAGESLKRNKRFLDEHGDQIDEYTKRKIEANDKYNQAVADGETNLKGLRARADREILQADSDREKEKEKKRKENQDKIDAENKKINDEAKSKRDAKNKKEQDDRQSAHDKELEDLKKNAEELADAKLKKETELKEKAKAILDAIDAELQPLETPAEKLQREFDENLLVLTQAHESTLGLENKFIADKLTLKSQELDKENELRKTSLEQEKILQAQKVSMLGVSFGKISELLGKNSKASKAFAVSQALINTYQGITAELATKTLTPYEFGIKVVNIASVAAIGFKSVKDILKTPEMSTGGGGGASGGGSSVGAPSSAPQFNVVGNAGVNQIAQTLGQPQPPIQAYVVAGQVTTAQGLNRNLINNATL